MTFLLHCVLSPLRRPIMEKSFIFNSRVIAFSISRLALFLLLLVACTFNAFSQNTERHPELISQPGILITIVLILIPLLAVLALFVVKINRVVNRVDAKKDLNEAERFAEYLKALNADQINELHKQRDILNYTVPANELSGELATIDSRGLLSNINEKANIRFIAEKKRSLNRPPGRMGVCSYLKFCASLL